MFKSTRPKTKKGQILIFVLVLMAMGLIIITPLLHFLNTSYNAYINIMTDTTGYYTADAMMSNIVNDMVSGQDVQNRSAGYYNTTQPSGWLNGCNVNTTISSSLLSYTVPEESDDWLYLDPGIGLLSDPLAHEGIHDFKVYLTENSDVTVHWYFNDRRDHWGLYGYCPYYCEGAMWVEADNASHTVMWGNQSNLNNVASVAFNQSLHFQVPANMSGNYTIRFQNLARADKMNWIGDCEGPYDRSLSFEDCDDTSYDAGRLHSIYDHACQSAFSGTGDMSHTWVKVGTILPVGSKVVQYREYTITTLAKRGNTDIASITARLRQSPGPLIWWANQNIEIVAWEIRYY
jgi:hypothetical protein